MTQTVNPQPVTADVTTTIFRLRELITALERRVPHLEREGETQIAQDGAALKEKALARIAELALKTDRCSIGEGFSA